MKYFTNSPFEKMMMQVPSGRQDYSPAPPPANKNAEHKMRKLIIVPPKQHKTGGQYE